MTAAPHPFAPFNGRTASETIALAALAGIAALLSRSPYLFNFFSLVLGYCAALLLLWPGQRLTIPWQIAIFALLSLVAGTAVAIGLFSWRPFGGSYIIANIEPVIALLIVGSLLLPGIGRRWLGWREQAALTAQAARHAVERTLLEARLAALQGQIEPHFLFNTLANVQYLLRRDSAAADSMLDHLLAYLRATLTELRQIEAPLGQEITRVRAYLDIMQIRMGERLRYAIDCPESLQSLAIPPLSLATLVENAIKHGLEPKTGGGSLAVRAWRDGVRLLVAVEDDGLGFTETGGEGGIGLRNLRERLQALCGDQGQLSLEAIPTGGVRALVELPAKDLEAP